MADTQEVSPATLLDRLASLEPQERREVATPRRKPGQNLPRCTSTLAAPPATAR